MYKNPKSKNGRIRAGRNDYTSRIRTRRNDRNSWSRERIDGRNSRNRRNSRNSRAHVLIELSCCCFMMVVFTILSADIGVLIYGAEFNDRACRDAARAAAQGQDAQQSTQLIKAILKAHQGDGNYITAPTMQSLVYNDYGGNPPAQTAPFVTVTTLTKARAPFAPLVFCKGPVFLQNGTFTFTQSYTFPIVKTK